MGYWLLALGYWQLSQKGRPSFTKNCQRPEARGQKPLNH